MNYSDAAVAWLAGVLQEKWLTVCLRGFSVRAADIYRKFDLCENPIYLSLLIFLWLTGCARGKPGRTTHQTDPAEWLVVTTEICEDLRRYVLYVNTQWLLNVTLI